VFWSFRVMVAIGLAMFGLGLWSLWLRLRKRLYDQRAFLRTAVLLGPSGLVAVIAGWITTEVGRQPYTIYGVLRTADSVSPVAYEAVASSLVAFVVVYFAIFGAGTFYMLRLMREPPHPAEPDLPPNEPMRAQGLMPGPVIAPAAPLSHSKDDLASAFPSPAGEPGRRPGEGRR
jgi:cytochrome d ubiquinol oxidase subunit I